KNSLKTIQRDMKGLRSKDYTHKRQRDDGDSQETTQADNTTDISLSLFVSLYLSLSLPLSIYLPICLSLSLSLSLSVSLSLSLSVSLSLSLSVSVSGLGGLCLCGVSSLSLQPPHLSPTETVSSPPRIAWPQLLL